MHHGAEVLLSLFIVFVAAQVGGEIAQRLKLPAVVGEIAVGCLVGPYALGWVKLNEPLELLAELGAVLLLFSVGLETRVDDLRKVGSCGDARWRLRRGPPICNGRPLGMELGV
jgi:Kef-type K+ transport system membrane component KefB